MLFYRSEYRLVLMKMEVFFILEKRFLLQISLVSGVKAQQTARKSDCFASSSKDTRQRGSGHRCYLSHMRARQSIYCALIKTTQVLTMALLAHDSTFLTILCVDRTGELRPWLHICVDEFLDFERSQTLCNSNTWEYDDR